MKNEIVIFENQNVKLEVNVKEETVWLNAEQIAKLFDRDIKTIRKHINNALNEEMDSSTVAKFATVQNEGTRMVERNIEYYNLDMIISIGYRVKSKNGVIFRKWSKSFNNSTLAALTLLIAQSNPKEKDLLIDLIMNFLCI